MGPLKGKTPGTPSPASVSTKRQRIAKLAQEMKGRPFTALSHLIDIDWLKEAYRQTRKSGAPGIDGVNAAEYAARLEENLGSLLDRAKSGRYRAPPVRRVHIPKGDGKETRPIGIPTFEDKVLQRAVAMVLEAIYEQDFHDCSYGFRPGRSAHQALQAFDKQMMNMGGGWVIEVDIRKFFDTLDHGLIHKLLRRRMRDGVLLRLIGKWLKAGVMEDGIFTESESGTPQGGVISPLLANVVLHEVLDEWFENEVKPRLRSRCFIVRYADDFVIGLSNEDNARRVMAVLPKRFEKHGLALHPTKTRLIPFRPRRREGDIEPGSFDLLGFTHHWAKSRRGYLVIKQKTARSRFGRALKRVAEWCRSVRHWTIGDQHRGLSKKLLGHYEYYGITGNSIALGRFRWEVGKAWYRALRRRSQRPIRWDRFNKLLELFPLPKARAVHSTLGRAANP
jgi:RNA-directed DNA polymerase